MEEEEEEEEEEEGKEEEEEEEEDKSIMKVTFLFAHTHPLLPIDKRNITKQII